MILPPSDFLLLGAGTASKWSITPAGVQRWPDGVWLRRWAGAAYAGLRFAGIPPARRLAFPHTWHAAEAFLSLLGVGLR